VVTVDNRNTFPKGNRGTIEQTEGRIQGPCKNQAAGETVLSGEVNGDSVTWKYEAKYDGATVVLVFKWTIESDSAMKGAIAASDPAGNNTTRGTFTAKQQWRCHH
jgi:hypothetical protein